MNNNFNNLFKLSVDKSGRSGMYGHQPGSKSRKAIEEIEEGLDYKGMLFRINRSSKQTKIPQVRLVSEEKSTVFVKNNVVNVLLGREWLDTIHKLVLPVIHHEGGTDTMTIFLSANKVLEDNGVEVYQTKAATVGSVPKQIKFIDKFVASSRFSGLRVRRMGDTLDEALSAVQNKEEELMLVELGLNSEEEE